MPIQSVKCFSTEWLWTPLKPPSLPRKRSLRVYNLFSYRHWHLLESHLPLALVGHLYCVLLVESEIRHQVDSWHNLEKEKWKGGVTEREISMITTTAAECLRCTGN